MYLDFPKIRGFFSGILRAKFLPGHVSCAQYFIVATLFFIVGITADNLGYADEGENRRVDISLSIFPRIVAVDNSFRLKLSPENKVKLVFLYREDRERARSLVKFLISKNKSIGGMDVLASDISLNNLLGVTSETKPTAIFLSERLSDVDLKKVIAIAEKNSCIVFSPFTGDVERGVAVGISVTNRVKPYFNIRALKRSKIVINALLMKMSRRYE